MQNQSNKRHEPRFGITSAVLPFLGNRSSDYQPFQYLVQDISQGGVRIAIPNWVLLREIVSAGEDIQLNAPFQFNNKTHDAGRVAWQSWDQDLDAQVCGISLHTHVPSRYPVHISLSSKEISLDLQDFQGEENLLLQVLNDSTLIKHGLIIYLGHLNAYFFRTSLISRQEYALFRELILDDISQRVRNNYQELMDICNQTRSAQDISEAFSRILNLEELRVLMQPEVSIELFARVLSLEVVDLYLKAIKTLEQKLYLNYNTVVMLYLKNLIQGLDPQATAEMPCLTCSAEGLKGS
ncbi:MAG: PilZ domain-containing protein [Desulfovermiculus sp.]